MVTNLVECLTYDDVNIAPAYSEVETRKNGITETRLTKNYKLDIPLIASPMDTVCELNMAKKMWELGGVGIIHRFMDIETQARTVAEFLYYIRGRDISDNADSYYGLIHTKNRYVSPVICAAIGAQDTYLERATALLKAGANVLLIDVAHGHHKLVKNALQELSRLKGEWKFDVIAGSVATADGAHDLIEWGADALRVGIGNGSVCSTRLMTGIGIPQVTAVMDCFDRAVAASAGVGQSIPIVADGGIRYAGDVAKALAAGAESVMIGSLFAGTDEAPGQLHVGGVWPNQEYFKMYRGSASENAKRIHNGGPHHVEGAAKLVPCKGSVSKIVRDIIEGLQSSMSYVGAVDVPSFQQRAVFIRTTNAGVIEALPHLL